MLKWKEAKNEDEGNNEGDFDISEIEIAESMNPKIRRGKMRQLNKVWIMTKDLVGQGTQRAIIIQLASTKDFLSHFPFSHAWLNSHLCICHLDICSHGNLYPSQCRRKKNLYNDRKGILN